MFVRLKIDLFTGVAGASRASTADKTTVDLAVEEAVATGVVEPDSETGPLAGNQQ